MERVSVVRAHDLLVLSMNHVLPVIRDSGVEWGGEMQYGLWRLLSERKKNDKTARPKLPLWEHFLIDSFQRNFFITGNFFISITFLLRHCEALDPSLFLPRFPAVIVRFSRFSYSPDLIRNEMFNRFC